MADGTYRLKLPSQTLPTVSCMRNHAHLQVMVLAEFVVSTVACFEAPRCVWTDPCGGRWLSAQHFPELGQNTIWERSEVYPSVPPVSGHPGQIEPLQGRVDLNPFPGPGGRGCSLRYWAHSALPQSSCSYGRGNTARTQRAMRVVAVGVVIVAALGSWTPRSTCLSQPCLDQPVIELLGVARLIWRTSCARLCDEDHRVFLTPCGGDGIAKRGSRSPQPLERCQGCDACIVRIGPCKCSCPSQERCLLWLCRPRAGRSAGCRHPLHQGCSLEYT